MPTIGSFDYPLTPAEDILEAAKGIALSFKTADFSRESLAHHLGYKNANNGTFNQRLADLRSYGILEGRGDSIRASELAQKLAAPAPGEYESAVREMAFKIPLFKALHDGFQGQTPDEDGFTTILINVAKADRIQVSEQSRRIRNLYNSATSKFISASGNIPIDRPIATMKPGQFQMPPMNVPIGSQSGMAQSPIGSGIIVFQAGTIQQTWPMTPDGVAMMAMTFQTPEFWNYLKSLAAKGESKSQSKETDDAPNNH